MRHLLLTGVMFVSALAIVWGMADMLEGSQRQHATVQAEPAQQPAEFTTLQRAGAPASGAAKVATNNN